MPISPVIINVINYGFLAGSPFMKHDIANLPIFRERLVSGGQSVDRAKLAKFLMTSLSMNLMQWYAYKKSIFTLTTSITYIFRLTFNANGRNCSSSLSTRNALRRPRSLPTAVPHLERQLTGQRLTQHHHPGHPEEQNVMSCLHK